LKTAVVILNYNGRELLQQFLPSVIRFSSSARIIVADNHSTDGSGEFLSREFPSIEVIHIPENLGFCGGYNFSLKRVEAEYYVLLNSDVEVTEGWLNPIINLLNGDPTIAAAQPKILSYRSQTLFEYAGAAGGFVDALGYPFCRGRMFATLEADTGQYNDTVPVFWATGACMFIRASAFHEMGGLDEDFFAHMEEIDLCWKLHRSGYQVYYVGNCTIYHLGGGTLSKSNPNKTYLNFRNGLSLIFKHLGTGELLWKLPLRMALDWCAAMSFLLAGSGRDAIAVAKAHLHFFIGLPKEYRKRKTLIRPFQDRKAVPIYPGVVVLDYFLLGRKFFKDLRRF
jgi:GT2 family glycosyltransferase